MGLSFWLNHQGFFGGAAFGEGGGFRISPMVCRDRYEIRVVGGT